MSQEQQDFYAVVGTAAHTNEVFSRGDRDDLAAPAPLTGPMVEHRSWAESNGVFWGIAQSHQSLPAGIYRMSSSGQLGPVFIEQKSKTDNLLEFPDSDSAAVLEEIRAFSKLRGLFKQYGYLYKRGFMFYGPAGSGKTCTIELIVQYMIREHNCICVLIENPTDAANCLQMLRRIEPERQIVGVLGELDALCVHFGESKYLALLDGESQIDNIIYLATTNYPERLDRRFTDRPSRFDTVRYIGMPNADARRLYLSVKIPDIDRDLLEELVKRSDGFAFAYLRELVVLTQCFNLAVDETFTRLNAMRSQKASSERSPGHQGPGFHR